MAQSTDSGVSSLQEVLIKIGGDVKPSFPFPQKNNDLPPQPSMSARRRNKEQLTGSEDCRRAEEEDVMLEISSNPTPRQSTRILSRTKSRFEDPNWKHNNRKGNTEKEEDWYLDDDLVLGKHMKKRSIVTVAQFVGLLLLLVAFACTLSISELKAQKLWELPLWKWEILSMVIICGHLVSGWAIRVIVFFIESNFLLKIRILYFVYGMRKAVQNCLWLGLVLIAWYFVVEEKIVKDDKSQVLHILTKVLICLLVGTILWLVKTFVVKALASSFHVNAFFNRIKVSLIKQYVIKKLSGHPIHAKQREQEEQVHTLKMKNDTKLLRQVSKRLNEINSIDLLQNLHKKNTSSSKMERLIRHIQRGDLPNLSTLDENLPDCSADADEEESSLRTRDEAEAKCLAKKIFRKVAKKSKFIDQDVLKRYIDEDKVLQAVEYFEGAIWNGTIDEQAFTTWMVNAFKERRTLALSLDDTKTAVDELHRMLDVIVTIIILLICLIIFGLPINHYLVLISSQFILAVYLFGETCRTVFQAIIFLFIMHPYDVGDRCEIDGVQMIVEEMNILTTVFLRYDQQVITYPNSVLATKSIGNYFRSSGMGDEVEFSVHISTPWEKIETVKKKIIEYIENRDDHWHKAPVVVVKNVEDMNRVNMVVWPRHQINHQEMGQRWERRSLLIEAMIKVFRELDIEYRMLPVDMNMRNISGVTSDRLPSNWKTCSY